MVGGDDDERVGIALLEIHADVDGIIERDLVVQRGGGIAGVARVIHASALDLQDEMLLVLEFLQRATGHHGERGHGGLELGVDALVEGEGEMALRKMPSQGLSLGALARSSARAITS